MNEINIDDILTGEEKPIEKSDPILDQLETLADLDDECSRIEQQLKSLKKKRDTLSISLAEAYDAREVQKISTKRGTFYLNTYYTCSTIGVSLEDAEQWAERHGHQDVIEKRIQPQRFKSLVIKHNYGDKSSPDSEPWWGDNDMPQGAELKIFEKVVRKGA